MEVSFEVIGDILDYIFNIPWTNLPYHIATVAVLILTAYGIAMFLIGFPVAVWEHFTKKKVNAEKEAKVIKTATIIFSVILIYRLLYENVR